MAKDVTLGKAKVSVVAETGQHDKDIDKAEQKVKKFGVSVEKMSAKAKTAWAAVAVGVAGAAYQLNQAINTASDLEEATSKFNTVFASQMSLANQWATELNKSYGMSTREAKTNLAAIQDLLVPMGMAEKQAGKLSKEVVKLATDLGSFNNKLTEQVIDDYQSALVGNFETMKKYGVVLNATVVSEEALRMGFAETAKELTASDKAQAAHSLIVKGSEAAIGDFIRTSDGYANTTKSLDAAWEDFNSTLGEKFLPTATRIKTVTAELLKDFEKMLEGPSLDEQIKSTREEIERLKNTSKGFSVQIETSQEQQIRQAETLKNTWMQALTAQKAITRGSVDLTKIQLPDQSKTIDNNTIALEAAQKRLDDLIEQQRKNRLEEQKKADKAESDARLKEKKRLAAEEEKLKKTTDEKRLAAEQKYQDFILSKMDKTTEEYQDAFIMSEMKKWQKVEGITQEQLDKINFLLIDGFKEVPKETEDIFKGVVENFTQAVQSELQGFFSDILTGELDTAEDYFRSFTNSLIQMWSAMAAKMVMTQSMWSAANFAGLGIAGVALGGIGAIIGSSQRRKAERERLRQLRAQTEQEVTSRIAELELTGLDYEIYQLNKRFEELYDIARKTKMPLDDILELRKLETQAIIEQGQAGFVALQEDISGFITGKQRQNWTVADWNNAFNNLSDEIMMLDKNSDDYRDTSIDLFTKQYNVLQNIYTLQENQLRALESTSQSLVAQAAALKTSEGMPVSRTYFESRYQDLLDAALLADPETGMLNTTDIAFFQSFVDDYISTMSMLGDDYNTLVDKAASDLLTINNSVQSEMEILTAALTMNSEAVEGNTAAILTRLDDLSDDISDVSSIAAYQDWMKLEPYRERDYFPFIENLDQYSKELIVWGESARNISDINNESLNLFIDWANKLSDSLENQPQYGESVGDFMQSERFWAVVWSQMPGLPFIEGEQPGQGMINENLLETVYGYIKPETMTEQDIIDAIGPGLYQSAGIQNVIDLGGLSTIDTQNTATKAKSISDTPLEVEVMQPIYLMLDGSEVARTVVKQSRINPELKRILN